MKAFYDKDGYTDDAIANIQAFKSLMDELMGTYRNQTVGDDFQLP